MKKWMSALLALTMLLTLLAGCGGTQDQNQDQAQDQDQEHDQAQQTPPSGIYYDLTGLNPSETAMTVDGSEVPLELYCYWTTYNCSTMEQQLTMFNLYYGLYGECFNEDGSLNWDAVFMEDQTLSQYIRQQTEETVKLYTTIENLAREHAVEMTEEDTAAMEADLSANIEQLGGEEAFAQHLAEIGISQESYRRLFSSVYLFENLTELVLTEGSPLYLELADYDQYATYADHILLSTVDQTTNEPLPEEEIAAKRATAEDILSQLQAAEDLETTFAQLADQHSEDPGRAGNPTGYVFGSGEMVASFEEAANALKPGEISGIVESEYGFHILLRRDLALALEADPTQKAALAKEHMGALASLVAQEAEVVRGESLDAIDPGAFYTAYQTVMAEREAQESAEEDAGAEDAADPEGAAGTDETGDGE